MPKASRLLIAGLLIYTVISGCATNPSPNPLTFEQRMMLLDRMRINIPQVPYYPMQVGPSTTTTCQQIYTNPLTVRCY